jgi:hypothetical protein
MSVFGKLLRPSILVFLSGGEVQGVCLLVQTRVRRAIVTVRRISLNATGEDACDTTYPEHNDLLCRPGAERPMARALAQYLRSLEWDEFNLDGFQPGPGYDALHAELTDLGWEEDWRQDFYVALERIRNGHGRYESILGANTRHKLRKTRKHFAGDTPLDVETPRDIEEALSMFNEMADLSRQRWESKANCSVFASSRFLDFHKRLIRCCLPQRTVQLLRVAAGGRTIGIVYVFNERGRVYFYQCGIVYGDDPRWSPGTLSMAEVIQHYVSAGVDEFDFLTGHENYKERLSTGSRRLVWATAWRLSAKTVLLRSLLWAKGRGQCLRRRLRFT